MVGFEIDFVGFFVVGLIVIGGFLVVGVIVEVGSFLEVALIVGGGLRVVGFSFVVRFRVGDGRCSKDLSAFLASTDVES